MQRACFYACSYRLCVECVECVCVLRSSQALFGKGACSRWVGWLVGCRPALFLSVPRLDPTCSVLLVLVIFPSSSSSFLIAIWCPIFCSILGLCSFYLRPSRIASRRASSSTAHTSSATLVRLCRVLGLDVECRRRCALLWPRKGLSIVPALLRLPNLAFPLPNANNELPHFGQHLDASHSKPFRLSQARFQVCHSNRCRSRFSIASAKLQPQSKVRRGHCASQHTEWCVPES